MQCHDKALDGWFCGFVELLWHAMLAMAVACCCGNEAGITSYHRLKGCRCCKWTLSDARLRPIRHIIVIIIT